MAGAISESVAADKCKKEETRGGMLSRARLTSRASRGKFLGDCVRIYSAMANNNQIETAMEQTPRRLWKGAVIGLVLLGVNIFFLTSSKSVYVYSLLSPSNIPNFTYGNPSPPIDALDVFWYTFTISLSWILLSPFVIARYISILGAETFGTIAFAITALALRFVLPISYPFLGIFIQRFWRKPIFKTLCLLFYAIILIIGIQQTVTVFRFFQSYTLDKVESLVIPSLHSPHRVSITYDFYGYPTRNIFGREVYKWPLAIVYRFSETPIRDHSSIQFSVKRFFSEAALAAAWQYSDVWRFRPVGENFSNKNFPSFSAMVVDQQTILMRELTREVGRTFFQFKWRVRGQPTVIEGIAFTNPQEDKTLWAYLEKYPSREQGM